MASPNPAAAHPKGDEDKELVGMVDESKDQVSSESSIPLSPQWLYAKPNDSKETRPPSIHGNTTDSSQKDAWRLDGSQDKKEWRRSTPEIEGARRWRDEERETSLLGRRERRKEGDRETDYRKGDRRSENTSVISDARSKQSSDRRNEVPSRNTTNESRRDNKWSSRWGPEDKEKEAKIEKKMEIDKDNDSHSEKQPIVSGLRPLSESDSRDKWRPRHRQETHSSGPSSYRAAPGFGMERGRIEGSTVGFAAGRGRSNSAAKISSAPIIGAAPFKAELALGKSNLSPSTFRYPRGKLIDIYRMQKLSIINMNTDILDEDIPFTQSDFVTPLAFVPPDDEEEVVLKDIWKGKMTSSEASHSSSCEQFIGVNESEDSEIGKDKDKRASLISEKVDLLTPIISGYDSSHDISVSLDNHYNLELEAHEVSATNKLGLVGNLDIRSTVKLDGYNRTTSMDDIANLPDHSLNLLNSSFIEIPTSEAHENKTDVQILGQDASPEELSLFYRDPQGEIQGPFLELDIISWFEQGFFGIDLPVCLSDAPEGSSFLPLGEIMPFLKERLQYNPDSAGAEIFDNLSTDRGNMQGNAPDISQQWSHPFDSLGHHVKKNIGVEASVDTNDDRFLFSMEEALGIPDAGGEIFQDSDELLYKGRHMTTMEKELLLPRSSSGHHYMGDMAETSLVSKKGTKDNDVNPLGLLLSELEVSYPKHPLSLSIPNEVPINQAATPNDFPFGHKFEQLNITTDTPIPDVWPGNYRNDRVRFAGDGLESSHLSRLDNDANHQSLDELMLLHQLQKQQQLEQHIQQQHLKQQIQQQQQLEQQRRQQQQLEQHLQKQQLEQHLQKQQLEQQLQKQQLQQHLLHQNVDLRPFLDQMRGSMHQQHSINEPAQDMDHFLKLQYEQQVHLRQVQQQHQLQQQLHQQHVQMLRQQQQQQHQQQHQQNQQKLLLEQLLHQHVLESGLRTSNIDHRHADRMLDQLVLQQHLLNESQQQPHNLYGPTIEQLIQAKFGQNLNQRDHDDLPDILPLARQRNMISSEQQLLLQLQQEQLQAHLSVASRQQLGMDEDRQMRGIWSVDEPGQYIRSAASPHQGRSARLGELDILQPPHRASSYEEPSQLEQNFLLHQRLHQGHNDHLHPIGPVGKFPSGIHSRNHLSEDHTAVHREATGRHLSETNDQFPTNLLESHFLQLQIEAEKQRSRKMNVPLEELKMWAYSQSGTDCSVDPVADRVGLGKSSPEVSLYSNIGKAPNEQELNLNSKGDANFIDGSGRTAFSSGSASFKQRQLLSNIHERDQFIDSLATDVSREGPDFLNAEGKMVKMQALNNNMRTHSAVDILEGSARQVAGIENEDIKFLRHASSGRGLSFSNYEMGLESAPVEMTNNRSSNSFLNRTNEPQSASSQSTVPEVASGQLMRGKSITSIASSDEAKRDPSANPALSSSESATANKKDARFRRTSSTSDADVSEPTFSDMLKSSKKPMPEADALAAADASETGGKGGKKKGKKGRQIDPSLLGFKVHSNRILMGEIQRADD